MLSSLPGCASGHHPTTSSGAGGGSHWPGGVPRTCCTCSRGQPVPGQPWACPKAALELPELLCLHQRPVGEPRHLWGEVAASFFLYFFFPLILIWDIALEPRDASGSILYCPTAQQLLGTHQDQAVTKGPYAKGHDVDAEIQPHCPIPKNLQDK